MEIAGVIERVERIAEVRANPAASASTISSGLVAVREAQAWLDAQHAGLVGQLRHVDSFPEKTIADAARSSLGAASRTTERSATLDATPTLASALGDGAITAGHVDALTRTSKRLSPSKRDELFERADALVAVAAAATVDAFARRLESEAKRLDDVDGDERLRRQRCAARARSWVDGEGMWNLSARLDPVAGVKVAARLDATVEALFAEAVPDECPADPIEKQRYLAAQAVTRLLTDVAGVRPRPGRAEFVAVIDADAHGQTGPVSEFSIPVEIPARCSPCWRATPTSPVSSSATASCCTPQELEPRPHHPTRQPCATTSASWVVLVLCDPRLLSRLRPLQAASRHLVAQRGPNRLGQPAAGLQRPSLQGSPRRLAHRAGSQPGVDPHPARRQCARHRATHPTNRRLTATRPGHRTRMSRPRGRYRRRDASGRVPASMPPTARPERARQRPLAGPTRRRCSCRSAPGGRSSTSAPTTTGVSAPRSCSATPTT